MHAFFITFLSKHQSTYKLIIFIRLSSILLLKPSTSQLANCIPLQNGSFYTFNDLEIHEIRSIITLLDIFTVDNKPSLLLTWTSIILRNLSCTFHYIPLPPPPNTNQTDWEGSVLCWADSNSAALPVQICCLAHINQQG